MIVLSSVLKPLGIFPFLMFGFAYCGAVAVLDWLYLSFSPEFFLTLSVVYLVLYLILWISQWRISPLWRFALLFIVAIVHYSISGDAFIQSLIYSIGISIILMGLAVAVNISCEEFCKRWDIEMPAKANADLRCPNCESSRIIKSSYYGASYDEIINDYSCKRCAKDVGKNGKKKFENSKNYCKFAA